MFAFLSTCEIFFETGFVFSILAMGFYVSYSILDFPDLTVEGTFLSGAVTYGLLISHGVNGWLALIAAFFVGAFFGMLTGILHVKLKIRPLLCGILISTILISVNLVAVSAGITGDFRGESASTINFARDFPTLHNVFPANLLPAKINGITFRDLILFLFVALIFKLILDLFLKTKAGLLLRATGDNAQYVTTLAKDSGNSKILGLAIGNGYAAVSGALNSQIINNVNQSMGVGMVVIGLASLIIGLSIFKKVRFMKPTSKVIIGAVAYQMCLTLAHNFGVPSAYNKMIMAILFIIALVASMNIKRKGGKEI